MARASTSDAVTQAIALHLSEYGAELRYDQPAATPGRLVPMTLEAGGQRVDVFGLFMQHLSATAALQAMHESPRDRPLLVFGPRIHESSAATLRARGIWYADMAGNAYLRHDGLVIDVRGRRGDRSENYERHADTLPANPFTPKRAQVGLALLSSPGLESAPIREIAERAGSSVGMAKDTLDTLKTAGFIEQLGQERRLIRAEELLNLWVSAYPTGLARSSTLLRAQGEAENWSPPPGIEFAISGEQAVGSVIRNPETLTIYVHGYVQNDGKRGPPRELMIENRWRRDGHGNIIIRELFWRDLPGIHGAGTAPPVLVYADLLASKESRQAEVAREIRGDVERLVRR